ncbi:dynamin family protein [Paraclostridium ghonii]|uniref:dynamin family protein n=1 Tax=Paraclostridium ghonii TaxID=29358 RepID=UPI0035238322
MDYSSRENAYKDINVDIQIITQNLKNIKIQSFLESSQTYRFITEMENEINKVFKSIEELKDPFLLFVMGSGKYGKSTLINSLIKDNTLKTKDIPNTWKLDIVKASNVKQMDIVYEDNVRSYSYDEGLLILKKEEDKVKDSKRFIKYQVDKLKKNKNLTINDLKDHKKSLEDKHLYKSDILEVRHYINKSGILSDFIIVDTPGLNQNLLKNTKQRMIDYYKRADGVLWVLDAKNIISKSSNDMIIDIKENYILDDECNNIICVVNKADEIRSRENDLLKVKEKAENIYSNYFRDIVFISSKEAIDGYINKDKYLENLSNIGSLRSSINKNFKNQSEHMQIRSKYRSLKISGRNLCKMINIYKRNLYKDLYQFDEIKRSLKDDIIKVKSYFINKLDLCIVLENFKINGVSSQLEKLEKIFYIEINNLYKNFNNKIVFYENEYDDSTDIDINITKRKEVLTMEHLILIYNNQNKETSILNKLKSMKKDEINTYLLIEETNKLKLVLSKYLEKKLEDLEKNIINKATKEFRKKYTDYTIIKNHLLYIDNIDSILKKWGDYGE